MTKSDDSPGLHFETLTVHSGVEPDPLTGAVMTPIYQTSTYVQSAPAENKGYVYARGDNKTRQALEGCLAALEGASHCTATSSGLGAETIVLTALGSGARVVAEGQQKLSPGTPTQAQPYVQTDNPNLELGRFVPVGACADSP